MYVPFFFFFKVDAVSEWKLNQQRMPGPLWLKILEKHYLSNNIQKWLDGGFFLLAHLTAFLGSWSQMSMRWRVNTNETLQVLVSNKQNHRVVLLCTAAHLTCLLFFLQTSVFCPSVPLWKRLMWLALTGGINMNNKLFLHVWSYRPIILAL